MDHFFLKANGLHHKIEFSDVRYIEAVRNYVNIHTVKQKLMIHCSLKQILELLPEDLFCRIHKSYIIALKQLTQFSRESAYLNTTELPIASGYYDSLKNKLTIVSFENHKRIEGNTAASWEVYSKSPDT